MALSPSRALKYARAHLGQAYLNGRCQAFTVRAYGAPGGAPTAAAAWRSAASSGNGHRTSKPPVGSAVYWTGGRTGAGHTAIVSKYVNGKPYVISTGINGRVAEVPLSYFGGRLVYQGWVSSINGARVDTSGFGSYNNSPSVGGGGGGGSSSGGSSGGGSSSGGSGIGGNVAGGFTKKEFYQYLSAQFGDLDTLFKLDKEAHLKGGSMTLRGAIDYIVKKKITDPSIMSTILKKTAWFKTYGEDITRRLIEEKQQPGLAKKSIDASLATIRSSLNSSGLQLTDAKVREIARNAWVYGWNADQIDQKIASAAAGTKGGPDIEGGEIGAKEYDLQTYADDFGTYLTDAQKRQLRQDLLDGKGDESVREAIRKSAASANPIFADRLEAGETLRSVTDAYFSAAADLLEVDANSLNWQDGLFKNGKAWTTTDEKTGKVRQKTLAEFERDIKRDNRWVNTKNAREELSNGAYDILKRFGLAAG